MGAEAELERVAREMGVRKGEGRAKEEMRP